MAMHKKAQSALSDIEEFFVKKMDGKEKDISDIVEWVVWKMRIQHQHK